MELTFRFVSQDNPSKASIYILKLNPNIYVLNQGICNWFEKLKKGLMDRYFCFSDIDPCLYLKSGMMVLTYVDD